MARTTPEGWSTGPKLPGSATFKEFTALFHNAKYMPVRAGQISIVWSLKKYFHRIGSLWFPPSSVLVLFLPSATTIDERARNQTSPTCFTLLVQERKNHGSQKVERCLCVVPRQVPRASTQGLSTTCTALVWTITRPCKSESKRRSVPLHCSFYPLVAFYSR